MTPFMGSPCGTPSNSSTVVRRPNIDLSLIEFGLRSIPMVSDSEEMRRDFRHHDGGQPHTTTRSPAACSGVKHLSRYERLTQNHISPSLAKSQARPSSHSARAAKR